MARYLYFLATMMLLFIAAPHAYASPELCGNNIDEDSVGGDLACSGDDADNDGYRDVAVGGKDCDDADPFIYPGRWTAGTDTYDFKQCDPLVADGGGGTGTYVNAEESATDSANFFTCHTGSGETIFIDPVSGDNGDSGLTPALAYADFTNLHRTTGSNPYTAGDCIVLLAGTHTWAPFTDDYTASFAFRITDGTSADRIRLRGYPGHAVVVDSGCDSGTPCANVSFASSDYFTVSDITFTGAYNNGLVSEGASNLTFEALTVHGTRGPDDTSITGGIRITRCAAGCDINHVIAYDNHKATANATNIQNSGNIIVLDSEVSLSYLWLWFETNTLAVTSGGRNFFLKHNDSSSSGTLSITQVQAAYGYNADYWFSGPVTASHLLSIDPGDSAFRFEDGGDPASELGGSITYSTASGAATPLFVKTDDADSLYGDNDFNNNVLDQGDSTYGIVRMSRFDATNLDAYLADFIDGTNQFDENCYYDATSLSYELAASDGGATYGSLAAWQAATYVGGGDWLPDANSFNENPAFDSEYAAQSANCSDKGWRANISYLDTLAPLLTPTVNTLVTTDTTPELTGDLDTANPAATVQVTVDESSYAATNNGDGTWTLADNTITPPLLGGRYDVEVEVTDGGDVGTDATLNELTIDIGVFGWAGSLLSRACGGCF